MNHYDGKNIGNAKRLRREMTPWERKLWYCFLKAYPARFQRQKCIDSYILDFYCAKAKLAVELDGGGHYNPESQQKDKERTYQINKYGIHVLRFSNKDVDDHFYEVCSVIDSEIAKRMK